MALTYLLRNTYPRTRDMSSSKLRALASDSVMGMFELRSSRCVLPTHSFLFAPSDDGHAIGQGFSARRIHVLVVDRSASSSVVGSRCETERPSVFIQSRKPTTSGAHIPVTGSVARGPSEKSPSGGGHPVLRT